MKCPTCSGEELRRVGPSSVVSYALFQFIRDKECTTCWTIWRPACPKWAAIPSIVLGGTFGIISSYAFLGINAADFVGLSALRAIVQTLFCMAASISAVVYGIGVLFDVAGKTRILKDGITQSHQVIAPSNLQTEPNLDKSPNHVIE